MRTFLRVLPLVLPVIASTAAAGDLYDESTYRALASDNKAYRVGDVITVQIFETSSASTSTDTATRRKNELAASLGIQSTGKQYGGTLAVSGDFDGGGTTQRTNKLLATVSVTVHEVTPAGDLRVKGEQVLTVNEEQHVVKVEGRVRPQDVSSDNVVLSTRLADSRIEFVGFGDLSTRQKRAWWRKILDWVGL